MKSNGIHSLVISKIIKKIFIKQRKLHLESNFLPVMNLNFTNPLIDNMTGTNGNKTYSEFVRAERKFAISTTNKSFTLAWLSQNLSTEQRYPVGDIYSVYFDTDNLDSYYQTINGDLEKQKVRIRWYGDPLSDGPQSAFIEVKTKVGFKTIKRRTEIPTLVPSSQINEILATIDKMNLQEMLLGMGVNFVGPISPSILIKYNRNRFISLDHDTSLSFDSNISSLILNPRFSTLRGWLQLKTSVLELKGTHMELPSELKNLHSLGTYSTSFSKYCLCLESHFDKVGSYGWLEPNFPSKGT